MAITVKDDKNKKEEFGSGVNSGSKDAPVPKTSIDTDGCATDDRPRTPEEVIAILVDTLNEINDPEKGSMELRSYMMMTVYNCMHMMTNVVADSRGTAVTPDDIKDIVMRYFGGYIDEIAMAVFWWDKPAINAVINIWKANGLESTDSSAVGMVLNKYRDPSKHKDLYGDTEKPKDDTDEKKEWRKNILYISKQIGFVGIGLLAGYGVAKLVGSSDGDVVIIDNE